jgi:hypothetical protein
MRRPGRCIVLIPGAPLQLIIIGVQVLAGIMLPSAIIFLQLLLNDKQVLGDEYVNKPWNNWVNWTIIIVLFILSWFWRPKWSLPNCCLQPEGERRGAHMSVMTLLRPTVIHNVSGDQFVVVHPLDDLGEEKVDTASLGRISMTTSVKISLMALRGYLVLMMLLVLYHVIDLSGALGSGTR